MLNKPTVGELGVLYPTETALCSSKRNSSANSSFSSTWPSFSGSGTLGIMKEANPLLIESFVALTEQFAFSIRKVSSCTICLGLSGDGTL